MSARIWRDKQTGEEHLWEDLEDATTDIVTEQGGFSREAFLERYEAVIPVYGVFRGFRYAIKAAPPYELSMCESNDTPTEGVGG